MRFRPVSSPLRLAVLVSVLLHAVILAAGIGLVRHGAPTPVKPDRQATVELLMVEQKGADKPAPRQPAPEVTPPDPAATSSAPPPSAPPVPPAPIATADGLPPPDPPRPDPPATPPPPSPAPLQQAAAAPPPRPAPLQLDMNGTDSPSNARAFGEGVMPASLDDRFRNRPPPYPDEAVRAGQQGSVVLLIHISAAGRTAGVEMLQSSGAPLLDQAARQAVLAWRFKPAEKDGAPVPFDMAMRFIFESN